MGGVQGSVVCACICLMSSMSFLLGTLLPLYVYIRTSTDVPLSELPQLLAARFSTGKAHSAEQNGVPSRCGSSLNGTSVDVLM